MTDVNCPLCNRVDMVQKVTAIVQRDTHKTSGTTQTQSVSDFRGGIDIYGKDGSYRGQNNTSGYQVTKSTTEINTTQMSDLAKSLINAKPDKPTAPVKPEERGGVSLVLWSFLGLLTIPITLNALKAFIDPATTDNYFLLTVFVSLIVGLCVGITLKAVDLARGGPEERNAEYERLLKEYDKRLQEHTEVNVPEYELRVKNWNMAFYCQRCDVTFIPGQNKYAKLRSFSAILKIANSEDSVDHNLPEVSAHNFKVVLKNVGQKKIDVVKVLRRVANLSLEEASILIKNTPRIVFETDSENIARNVKSELEAKGAFVDIE